MLLWYTFYFVDRFWYHPLLKASVDQGHALEDEIAHVLPNADLTKTISAGSPVPRPLIVKILTLGRHSGDDLHSKDKLVWFYRFGALALIAAALAFGVRAIAADADDKPQQPTVIVEMPTGSVTPTKHVERQPRRRGDRP